MIKLQNLLLYIVLILFSLCAMECKKEDHQFDAIQASIQGKWKLEFAKGGVAYHIQYFSNSYYTFFSNRILIVTNGTIYTDTMITWARGLGVYSGNNSDYILSFFDKQNVPWNYVVDGIINDSLILHDNSSDAMYYHFSKSH